MASERQGIDQDGHDADEVATIPVVAERADIDVEEVTTGRVRVSTRTDTVEQLVEETLDTTTVEVVRVPIGRELEAGEPLPGTRVESGVTIVPVIEERLVVEKRLVLVEEVRLERRTDTERVSVPVALRRQRVDVERESDASDPDVRPQPTTTDR